MKAAWMALGLVLLFLFQTGTAFANDSELKRAVDEVVGTPYKWGGTTTKGFDCSGFIRYIFLQFHTELPRTSKSQAKVGEAVSKEDLRPGDLVFYNTDGNGISHAGIYLGDGEFAHASSKRGVTIDDLNERYYKERYVTARRVVKGTNYSSMIDSDHEDSSGE